jgi:replicative DNA helicase
MENELLPVLTAQQAIEQAKRYIEDEAAGNQLGLLSRYRGVNVIKSKYWRFNRITAICGMSGGGKSTFLTNLHRDFCNRDLNYHFYDHSKVLIIHACYEMAAYNEILRAVAADTGISYNRLISSEWDSNEKNFVSIGEDNLNRAYEALNELQGIPIVFIETAGSLTALYNTVKRYIEKYPDRRIVLSIDHILLSSNEEGDDNKLMADTAKMAIKINKMGVMVNLIAQLNTNIEDPARRNKKLHYPLKSDIHGSKQLYWACDDIVIIHRPEMLGISLYGPHNILANKLVHMLWIKTRFNKPMSVFLLEELHTSGFRELSGAEIKELMQKG